MLAATLPCSGEGKLHAGAIAGLSRNVDSRHGHADRVLGSMSYLRGPDNRWSDQRGPPDVRPCFRRKTNCASRLRLARGSAAAAFLGESCGAA